MAYIIQTLWLYYTQLVYKICKWDTESGFEIKQEKRYKTKLKEGNTGYVNR